MNVIDQLILSTVRLETENSTGTGFFYKMCEQENDMAKIVIVTNRHVVENACILNVTLKLTKDGSEKIQDFNIKNLRELVVYHPDPETDLAVIPVTDLFNKIQSDLKYDPVVTFLGKELIPNVSETAAMSSVEDVLVIGYPNGLWDSKNVRPLVRRGITASDYKLDYEGESKFIIDCEIVGGSSGSPVFSYSTGTHHVGDGNFILDGQPRVKFLGINSSVFIQGVEGKLITTDYIDNISSYSKIPIGLGIIIKSSELEIFENLLP
ncbi:S1 family peptidase [Vagococcus fluvialis]|uniref:S1 family peptidase n=1 Tax=Vagococcus fluvialis TaxID=2738 RepID=UPI003B5A6373